MRGGFAREVCENGQGCSRLWATASGRRLAGGAEVGGSPCQCCFDNGLRAVEARTILAAIDLEVQLKIARIATGPEKIGNGRATGINGLLQDPPALGGDSSPIIKRKLVGRGQGVDAGGKKGFVGVNIADSSNKPPIHKQRFDGRFSVAGNAQQVTGVELGTERFDALLGRELAFIRFSLRCWPDGKGAESAAVIEAHLTVVIKRQYEVVVLMARRFLIDQTKLAGHAQMNDQDRSPGHSQ